MAYSDEVLADSPWLYWRLGDTSGTTATDSSGNGRTGTYSGTFSLDQNPLVAEDRSAYFEFSPEGHVLSTVTFNNSQVTFEVWFDYDGIAPGATEAQLVAGCVEGDGGGTADKLIVIDHNVKPVFYVFDGAGKAAVGANVLTTGIHHLVGTYDGTNAKIWVDGVEAGSVAASSTFTGYGGNNVICAGVTSATVAGDTVRRKLGRRDELAVYTTFIGGSRILAHYNAGFGTPSVSVPAEFPARKFGPF